MTKMIKHYIIRVGETHYGALVPGMLIVLPENEISFIYPQNNKDCFFCNPIDSGWSTGYCLGEVGEGVCNV